MSKQSNVMGQLEAYPDGSTMEQREARRYQVGDFIVIGPAFIGEWSDDDGITRPNSYRRDALTGLRCAITNVHEYTSEGRTYYAYDVQSGPSPRGVTTTIECLTASRFTPCE